MESRLLKFFAEMAVPGMVIPYSSSTESTKATISIESSNHSSIKFSLFSKSHSGLSPERISIIFSLIILFIYLFVIINSSLNFLGPKRPWQ